MRIEAANGERRDLKSNFCRHLRQSVFCPKAGSWWASRDVRQVPCVDSKLMISWLVGGRDSEFAMMFVDDLRARLANRVQLTSDGHKAYLEAVEGAFGSDVDYAQLVKLYGASPETAKGRYSPAECIGAQKTPIEGNPDPKHISTSFAERQNLNMRMHMRRFTRQFSKKVENHAHNVALFAFYYNYVRILKTLRVTPAMAARVTDKLWEVSDIVAVLEAPLPNARFVGATGRDRDPTCVRRFSLLATCNRLPTWPTSSTWSRETTPPSQLFDVTRILSSNSRLTTIILFRNPSAKIGPSFSTNTGNNPFQMDGFFQIPRFCISATCLSTTSRLYSACFGGIFFK